MSVNLNIQASAGDKAMIDELMEGSPFKQDMLLAIALRIGLKAIKQDPSVLMPYVVKGGGE